MLEIDSHKIKKPQEDQDNILVDVRSTNINMFTQGCN